MAAIWRSTAQNYSRLLTGNNSVVRNIYRTNYYVLLPEVPPDTRETNSVLRTEELVDFKSVSHQDCLHAVAKLSLEQESGIWKLENQLKESGNTATFESVMGPLEKFGAPLDAAWGLSKTLYVTDSELMPSGTYKQIHNRAMKARSVKFQSKPIYEACKKLLKEDKSLNGAQQRLLNKYVLEGRFNGAELSQSAMKNYTEVSRKLDEHKSHFRDKVEKATAKFSHTITDPEAVRAFPSELLRATAADPSAPSRGPWKITLQPHIYQSFMEHCPDPLLRWNVHRAHRSRGSNAQDKQVATSLHLEEVRFQRRDQVKYLGYPTYADMSMTTKMAGSVQNVLKVLELLKERALPAQKKELASLTMFAEERGFAGPLNLWDVPYWRRKQLSSLSPLEEGEVREYFPLPRVLSGITSLLQDVFGIHLEAVEDASTWHPDTTLYAVRNSSGQLIGHIYLDLYARVGRKLLSREAASWMIPVRNRSAAFHPEGEDHTPVAAVVLNLTPPLHGIPSLLSFGQVQTLLNKVGHALQHLLTEAPYAEVAGLSNLEWDAVQITAQFFQCWTADWAAMSRISGHFESGQPLSKDQLARLNSAATHMVGTDLCHQLYLATLDIELYSTKDFWLDIVKRLWPQFYPFPLDKSDSHPCNFTEIISGDLGAAYYSHLWAKMVAADLFSAFQEASESSAGLKSVGDRFRTVVLANGGAVHPGETFRLFRGRDPSPDALLKHAGLE